MKEEWARKRERERNVLKNKYASDDDDAVEKEQKGKSDEDGGENNKESLSEASYCDCEAHRYKYNT